MAAEVIALLHSLLTAPESNTAQIWTSTAEKVHLHASVTDHYLLLTTDLVHLEKKEFPPSLTWINNVYIFWFISCCFS